MPLSHLIALIINAHSPLGVAPRKPNRLATVESVRLSTVRKTIFCLLRDRSERRAVKRALGCVSHADHHHAQRSDRSPLHDVKEHAGARCSIEVDKTVPMDE